MARKTKVESAQTRARILDAAETEMLAHGVSQATLECIARRANVSRGAIYWHFADKTALVEAMVQRTAMPLRDLRQCFGQHIPGNEPMRLMREMLLHGISRLTNDEQHRRVCHIVFHRCEMTERGHATDHLLSAMFEDSREVLVSLCTEIAAICPLREPLCAEDAADVIIAFMVGLYECSLRHPGLYSIEHCMEAKVDAVLGGLFHPTGA
ncbi:TetR family transcriptional regulator [Salinisphaera sp.]|uniref:TetR family transcriptional regulator n=1 Tax=Salinisphaera sp. TaxID=1914330 RepID=UPI002D78C083|nr:TetR family transcriptional regulator [Salinisphaera sp.]HET7314919.1 TetR family transcriptional regulator [Salinisphaera sp.]